MISGTNPLGAVGNTTVYDYGMLSPAGTLTPGTSLARKIPQGATLGLRCLPMSLALLVPRQAHRALPASLAYQGTNTSATGTKLSQTEYRYDVAGRTAEVKVDAFGGSPS
ncbi:hypothetical protein K2X85_20325, partial [bacterium]|nr:hypothetical protein [bacterium]